MQKDRTKVSIIFEVDLDPTPGVFHQASDWGAYVKQLLEEHTKIYNGKVVKVVTAKALGQGSYLKGLDKGS